MTSFPDLLEELRFTFGNKAAHEVTEYEAMKPIYDSIASEATPETDPQQKCVRLNLMIAEDAKMYKDEFIVCTPPTYHMWHDISLFTDIKTIFPKPIVSMMEPHIYVIGQGAVKCGNVILHEVLYIPFLLANILGTNRMLENFHDSCTNEPTGTRFFGSDIKSNLLCKKLGGFIVLDKTCHIEI
ncbi:hypothetical protein, no similarity [Maudiozyma saulgeensis]|uniref:Uncharacterized protein n=1 Tax=Maudiozyma saulgeensis TaxID=1789683 RepID=A0A1X7QWV0_9SACH|nr:hypothetical protein, no similarity [Kazachstania saulgeensis]